MTREEAIQRIKDIRWEHATNKTNPDHVALSMAIAALSVEGEYIKKEDLFERTINRNSVWNTITDSSGWGLEEIVNDLPTYSFPDREKGEWIYKDPFDAVPYCSKCGKEPDTGFLGVLPETCPHCNAVMRGE